MTMSEFMSPQWWVTTVIGSAIMSIFSGYVRSGIEKSFSKSFSALSTKSNEARAKFEIKVRKLKYDRTLKESYFRAEIRYRLTSIYLMILVIAILLVLLLINYAMALQYPMSSGGVRSAPSDTHDYSLIALNAFFQLRQLYLRAYLPLIALVLQI